MRNRALPARCRPDKPALCRPYRDEGKDTIVARAEALGIIDRLLREVKARREAEAGGPPAVPGSPPDATQQRSDAIRAPSPRLDPPERPSTSGRDARPAPPAPARGTRALRVRFRKGQAFLSYLSSPPAPGEELGLHIFHAAGHSFAGLTTASSGE